MNPRRSVLLSALLLASTPFGAAKADDRMMEVEAIGKWSYYNNMGWKAIGERDYDTAEFRFSKAIQVLRPYQGRHIPKMVRSYHDLSRVLCAQKRYREALPLAKWVVEARDHEKGVREDSRFDAIYLLATIERELRHDAEVVPLLKRAVEIEARNVGESSTQLALTIKELADAEAAVGSLSEADVDYRRAIRIQEKSAPDSPDLAAALSARARVLDKLGRGAEARVAEARAAEILGAAETAVTPAAP